MKNELLQELSLIAHIKIRNRFTGFFASTEAIAWHIEAEHCTHRGRFFRGEGSIKDLDDLIKQAIVEMEKVEQRYADKIKSLSVLYPQLDDYQLADMARNFDESE